MSSVVSKLESAIIGMINTDGMVFYASLLLQMVRVETEQLPTMGVTINNGRILLYVNPKFVDTLTVPELRAVMEHECLHLVMDHLIRGKDLNKPIFNVAADIAINQLIKGVLPKTACTPEMFNFPKEQFAEVYYQLLMKNAKHITITFTDGKGGSGGKQQVQGPQGTGELIDDHGVWDEVHEKGGTDLNREIVKQAIKQAVEHAQRKSRGHLPGAVEQMIEEWLKPPTVPWQQVLRMFIGNSVKAEFKRSWKRMSRRFGETQKGFIPSRILKLAVAIDTSGSVGDEELQDFVAEIKEIQNRYRSNITVIECDAEIQKVYELTPMTKVQRNFKGRGGTDFEPVFKYIDKNMRGQRPDLLVYLTDLECSFPKEPPCQMVWCASSNASDRTPPYGMVVHITRPERDR